jgi:hypothetical protein
MTVKKEMTSNITLWMLSEGNATKNEEPTSDFTFTRMLQHTGWFWSRISYQRTI